MFMRNNGEGEGDGEGEGEEGIICFVGYTPSRLFLLARLYLRTTR